jgi:hypothetical protein
VPIVIVIVADVAIVVDVIITVILLAVVGLAWLLSV